MLLGFHCLPTSHTLISPSTCSFNIVPTMAQKRKQSQPTALCPPPTPDFSGQPCTAGVVSRLLSERRGRPLEGGSWFLLGARLPVSVAWGQDTSVPRKLLSRFANQLDFSEGHKLLSGEEWVGVCGRVRGRGQRGQKPQSRESIWRTKGKGCVSLCPHGSQARVCHVLSYSQRAQLTEGAEAVVQIPSGLTMAWRPGVGRKAGWLVSCALQRSRHFGAQAKRRRPEWHAEMDGTPPRLLFAPACGAPTQHHRILFCRYQSREPSEFSPRAGTEHPVSALNYLHFSFTKGRWGGSELQKYSSRLLSTHPRMGSLFGKIGFFFSYIIITWVLFN